MLPVRVQAVQWRKIQTEESNSLICRWILYRPSIVENVGRSDGWMIGGSRCEDDISVAV